MAFDKTKLQENTINNGVQLTNDSELLPQDINAMVGAILNLQDTLEYIDKELGEVINGSY